MVEGTLAEIADRLARGAVSSRQLVEEALARIKDPDGEGARAFVAVDDAGALAAADQADRDRAGGHPASALAGIPISVKDLFDLEGQVTRAGSTVLADHTPAQRDAAAIARLRQAGLIFVGRTNMTEFAYSGLGLNPHYGTPRAPFERDIGQGRIPGGSSSGAAVSVADGMVAGAIGTDTGGSCRIPAAFCGIVGFKPTARRVALQGAFPLSGSLDSIGPLARSADCCQRLDAIMAGCGDRVIAARDPGGLRLGVLGNYVLEDMDQVVGQAYEAALARLSAAGVRLVDVTIPELAALPDINARGGIVAAEAYQIHKELIGERRAGYDPRVSVRILRALEQYAGELDALRARRGEMIRVADQRTDGLDAVVMPTVPIVAPRFSEVAEDGDYGRLNLIALRNPTVANFLDRCAISLPASAPGAAPAGFMVMGDTMADDALFGIACGLEEIIRPAM